MIIIGVKLKMSPDKRTTSAINVGQSMGMFLWQRYSPELEKYELSHLYLIFSALLKSLVMCDHTFFLSNWPFQMKTLSLTEIFKYVYK